MSDSIKGETVSMTISILGTDYDFAETNEKQDSRLEDRDGYMDGYAKLIRINNDWNENHSTAIRNFPEYKKQIKRHEIIHSFLHESGLREYCENELIVDWMAIQFPKILSAFQKADCI